MVTAGSSQNMISNTQFHKGPMLKINQSGVKNQQFDSGFILHFTYTYKDIHSHTIGEN